MTVSLLHCFHSHPVVGILPANPGDEDLGSLVLLALGGTSALSAATDSGDGTSQTPVAVILYTALNTTGDVRNGQATARLGADLHCTTTRPTFTPNNGCTNVRAFISLTATDDIRDMPANYGVPTRDPAAVPRFRSPTTGPSFWISARRWQWISIPPGFPPFAGAAFRTPTARSAPPTVVTARTAPRGIRATETGIPRRCSGFRITVRFAATTIA